MPEATLERWDHYDGPRHESYADKDMTWHLRQLEEDRPFSFIRVAEREMAHWAGWTKPITANLDLSCLQPITGPLIEALWKRKDPRLLWTWALQPLILNNGPMDKVVQDFWAKREDLRSYPILYYPAAHAEFFQDGCQRLLRAVKRHPVALVGSGFYGALDGHQVPFARFADHFCPLPAAYPEKAIPGVVESLGRFLQDKRRAVVLVSAPTRVQVEILGNLMPHFGDRVWFWPIGSTLDGVQGLLGNNANPFYRRRREWFHQQDVEAVRPLVDKGLIHSAPGMPLHWKILKHESYWRDIQWHMERVRSGNPFTLLRIGEMAQLAVARGSYAETGWDEAPPDSLVPVVRQCLLKCHEHPENLYASHIPALLESKNLAKQQDTERLWDEMNLWHYPTMNHAPFWPLHPDAKTPLLEFLEFIREQEAVIVGPEYYEKFQGLLGYKDLIPLPISGVNKQYPEHTNRVRRFLQDQQHSRTVILCASSVVIPLAVQLHDAFAVKHTLWPIGQYLDCLLRHLQPNLPGNHGNSGYRQLMPDACMPLWAST